MATNAMLPDGRSFQFGKNLPLLDSKGSLGFRVSSQIQADVALALASDSAPFPSRDISLAEVGLSASTAQPIVFARGTDKISFTASGSAFAGLGVYRTDAALVAQLGANAADFSLDALEFGADSNSLLGTLRWGFSAEGKASGAMALSAAGSATLAVSGNSEGLYAVIRRMPATTPARSVVQQIADSWMLPRHVTSCDQLEPGTWIVAEVLGGISAKLGAQVGYDFNWVRAAKLGGLSGDIGLRLQMGVNAAVGFSSSGRCAVVVSRESEAKVLRLRYFRLKMRELDMSFDAALSVQAVDTLLPNRIDDFIAGVFDTHGQQILSDLKVLEKWTDPSVPLATLLANAGIDGAEKLIANIAGVAPEQLQQSFDAVQRKAVGFIQQWQALPHTVSSAILKMVQEGVDLGPLRDLAAQLSNATPQSLTALLTTQLNKVDFFQTPVGRLLESYAEKGVLSLLEKPVAEVQQFGRQIASVLDGSFIEDALTKFQAYVNRELNLDKVMQTVTVTDFAALDGLLKRKLANFLGQNVVVLTDLDKVRQAIQLLLNKRQEYYAKAMEALHRKYNFELSASYQSTDTRQAFLDASFDFSQNSATVGALFDEALQGNLDHLLSTPNPQITIGAGRISHGIKRQTQVDVTLPFLKTSTTTISDTLATMEAAPNGGGLLFKVAASSTVVASNQRKSVLSFAMGLSDKHPDGAVRLHQDSLEMNYSLLYAKRDMKRNDLRAQFLPAVAEYFSAKVPNPATFVDFIGQRAAEAIPNSGNVLGSGLVSLQVSLSAQTAKSAGLAWMSAPVDAKSPVYADLSTAIQVSLKKCIHQGVFADPKGYTDTVATAQTVLVYCAIVPRAGWDYLDPNERANMLRKPQTMAKLTELLTQAQDVLAGDSGAASFLPQDAGKIVSSVNPNDPVLQSLLSSEALLIKNATEAALKIAPLGSASGVSPSDAVDALAVFGAKLTEAFDAQITNLLGPGIQALGTRVFLDASCAFDPAVAVNIAQANAMLNVEMLKPDVPFNAKDLLSAGRIDATQVSFADRIVSIAAHAKEAS